MNVKIQCELKITHKFIGFHRWAAAPTSHAFLRNLHRHVFGVEVWFRVEDYDRQLEFFHMQSIVQDACSSLKTYEDHEEVSCEVMAQRIMQYLWKLNLPVTKCSVDEDGENASVLSIIAT